MDDNSISAQLMRFFDQIKIYLGLRVESIKLHVADYLIRFFSSLVLLMIIFWVLFFVVFFCSFAFAYWFGDKTGHWALGYLIIAGFYVLMALCIYIFRRPFIVRPFTRYILNHMDFEKFNDLENEKE
jgi:hypothetical protein